jgi:hypothetical protein
MTFKLHSKLGTKMGPEVDVVGVRGRAADPM